MTPLAHELASMAAAAEAKGKPSAPFLRECANRAAAEPPLLSDADASEALTQIVRVAEYVDAAPEPDGAEAVLSAIGWAL